jgi:hypothetical protein
MIGRSFKFFDPAWIEKERRHAPRLAVDWAASVAADRLETKAVRITDCTNQGCRIETDLAVTVGTLVYVTVPLFTEVAGWIVWSSHDAIGVEFDYPLPSRVLEYIIERNDPF